MNRKTALFGDRPGLSKEAKSLTFIDKDIEQIQGLHKSIGANLNNALQNAILIGEILFKKKEELKHGEFIPWIEKNLPFSRVTANKYLRLFENNPTRKPDVLYLEYKNGKTLSKNDRVVLKEWLNQKAENLEVKASELRKEIKKLK